jgi:hypothetical protein
MRYEVKYNEHANPGSQAPACVTHSRSSSFTSLTNPQSSVRRGIRQTEKRIYYQLLIT